MTRGKKLSSRPPPAAHRPRSPQSKSGRPASAPDERALLHELRVHQVELEVQNEELRAMRLETEAALARYTELFDVAPLGYATIAASDGIVEINHAGAQLLGWPRSVLRGRNFLTLVLPEYQLTFRNLVVAAESSSAKRGADIELRTEGGSALPVRLSIVALPRAEGKLLVAFEDIAELRGRQLDLERKERSLREADRQKDEFLALLSQELRNPLAFIRNSLLVLEGAPPGGDAARRARQIIDRQVGQLTRLIDDLLDVARIARGEIELRLEHVELSGLLRRTLEDHASAFAAAGIAVDLQLPSEVWVQADPARLVQVLSYIMGNALKFTPRGGRVRASLQEHSGRALLCIADSGLGLPRDVLERVFEPFAHASQTPDRSNDGLGLGLAMVKGLVELHGGIVSVRSAGSGSGTHVEVRLSVCAPPATPATSSIASLAGGDRR